MKRNLSMIALITTLCMLSVWLLCTLRVHPEIDHVQDPIWTAKTLRLSAGLIRPGLTSNEIGELLLPFDPSNEERLTVLRAYALDYRSLTVQMSNALPASRF